MNQTAPEYKGFERRSKHPDDAGRRHRACGPGDAAHRPSIHRIPDHVVGIEQWQPPSVEHAAVAAEIPPWHSVRQERDRSVLCEKRSNGSGDFWYGGCLHGHKHGVLNTELGRIGARPHSYGEGFVRSFDSQTVLPDGAQVRSAGDHGHVRARSGHVAGYEAAYRPGAEDADSQGHTPLRKWTTDRNAHLGRQWGKAAGSRVDNDRRDYRIGGANMIPPAFHRELIFRGRLIGVFGPKCLS